jgi:Zn-dependent protease/CBS domain-containing protein
MRPTFRVGRLAGVDIGIHWSWLLVFALIVWSLAGSVFPETNPGLADGTYVAMGAIAVTLFFTSLLLHELGHATRAQREGMEIEGITLWIFGGIAQFKGAFPSAGAEFRIAIAGPLVTLVIGSVLLAVALLVPLPGAVDGVAFWLGYINLFLLAFNLLPALPLDGGRVLRSALWARRGDFLSATRSAARIGQGFGRGMIALGAAAVLLGGAIGGLWIAFIGWFLLAAAEAEWRAAEASEALSGLTVADVMVASPVTAAAGMSLDEFLDVCFGEHRYTAYPVLQAGRPAGLISFRDALRVAPEGRGATRVADAMTPLEDAAVFSRAEPLEKAVERLATVPANRGLVIDDGMLRGLLSITDASRLIEAARRSSPPRPAAGEDRGDGAEPKLGRDEDHDRRVPGEHAGLPG